MLRSTLRRCSRMVPGEPGGLDIDEPAGQQVAYAASMVVGLPAFNVGDELTQRALGLTTGAREVPREVGRPVTAVSACIDTQLPLAAAWSTPFVERASHLLLASKYMSKDMSTRCYLRMR